MSFAYWLNLTIVAACSDGQFDNHFEKKSFFSQYYKILVNALLVNFEKFKNIAKCIITLLFLKKIPIIDIENIGKKKLWGRGRNQYILLAFLPFNLAKAAVGLSCSCHFMHSCSKCDSDECSQKHNNIYGLRIMFLS